MHIGCAFSRVVAKPPSCERVHRELGTSVVIAEQTVPRLLKIATDVYVLSRGHVAIHAPPIEITEEQLQRVYLT